MSNPPPDPAFTEHMDPNITWYVGEAYSSAFRHLMENPDMAALTNKSDPVTGATPAVFPAFIEVRYEDDQAVLTVRGDPTRNPPVTGAPTALGATVVATFTKADWEQFMSWSIRDAGLPAG